MINKLNTYKTDLFIITGGPGVGKTTLINGLANKGFTIATESARAIIKDQVDHNGDGVPWKNKQRYAELMFKESLKAYHQIVDMHPDRIAFFDRGLPDTLCYMNMENIPVTEKCYDTIKATVYNKKVFILPPWEEIYETDTERKQSWDEAVFTYQKMKETYTALGYDVVTVPIGSVERRCAFILARV